MIVFVGMDLKKISDVECVVVGDAAKNYKFTNDVKAVTYSEMYVKQVSQAGGSSLVAGGGEGKGKFVCEVVLDV